jgi:hypothetical protein
MTRQAASVDLVETERLRMGGVILGRALTAS